MIYDPDANLTWLRDWTVNAAKPWIDQLIWASNLQTGAFANWSLPSARNPDGSGPCLGYFCTGSQMGYMWYEVLGNEVPDDFTGAGFDNSGGLFPLAPLDFLAYWSGTECANGSSDASCFDFYDGSQSDLFEPSSLHAAAVRPGDVAAPMPEPQTWAMLMMGLGVVTVALRRRRR